jgi:hypothetical protein
MCALNSSLKGAGLRGDATGSGENRTDHREIPPFPTATQLDAGMPGKVAFVQKAAALGSTTWRPAFMSGRLRRNASLLRSRSNFLNLI